jgi:hypothetical protein
MVAAASRVSSQKKLGRTVGRFWICAVSLLLAADWSASAAESEAPLLRRLARLESQVNALKAEVARHKANRAEPSRKATRAAPSGDAPFLPPVTKKPATAGGAYVAAFGAISQSMANSEPNAPYIGLGLNPSALNPSAAGIALGYNFQSAGLLFGLETAWRYDFGGDAHSSATSVFGGHGDYSSSDGDFLRISLPFKIVCGSHYPFHCETPPSDLWLLATSTTNSVRIAERGGGELVGRIGATLGDFGRYFARAEANAAEYIGTSNGLGIDNAFARYDARLGLGLLF